MQVFHVIQTRQGGVDWFIYKPDSRLFLKKTEGDFDTNFVIKNNGILFCLLLS